MAPDRRGRPSEPEEEWVAEDDRVIGRAFRWSLAVLAVVAVVVIAVLYLTREKPVAAEVVERGAIEAPRPLDQSTPKMPEVRFTDVTRESGVGFVHVSGATGEKLLPE